MFKIAFKEAQMRGWITKLAGVGAILTGAGGIIQQGAACGLSLLSGCGLDAMKADWLIILTALAAIGIGRKIDKNTAAVEQSARPPALTG